MYYKDIDMVDTSPDHLEQKRNDVFKNFCFQYDAITTLIMGLKVDNALKAEIGRQFRSAFLWSKEAFIQADFNDHPPTEKVNVAVEDAA